MSEKNVKPIIFLAFANISCNPLPRLDEECRQLTSILERATRKGDCDLVVRPYATVNEVLETFEQEEYRDRIAVFHYAGHADSTRLFLERTDGAPAMAHADGLAVFLGHHTGLRLVFLNGCSTQPQVQGLLDAGVDAVIATAQAIDDQAATGFASHFFQYLVDDNTIQSAFDKAQAAMQFAYGGDTRHFYAANTKEALSANGWPWMLHPRPGADKATQWKLSADQGEDVDIRVLRKLLRALFDDLSLRSFILDNYPMIFDKLSERTGLTEMIEMLVEYCRILPSRRKTLLADIRGRVSSEEFKEIYH